MPNANAPVPQGGLTRAGAMRFQKMRIASLISRDAI